MTGRKGRLPYHPPRPGNPPTTLPPFGEVVVLPHAVERAQQRLPEFRGKDAPYVRAAVVARIREAAAANGTVFAQRPRQFRVPGERLPLPVPWQRVVVSGQAAFLVDVSLAPSLKVITTYVRLREPGERR